MQMIDFPTRQRVINNATKTSVLDHVYVQDPTTTCKVYAIASLIDDRTFMIFDARNIFEPTKVTIRGSWKTYSKQSLLDELAVINFSIETGDVQSTYNNFENFLLHIIDKLASLVPFSNNFSLKSPKPKNSIKN